MKLFRALVLSFLIMIPGAIAASGDLGIDADSVWFSTDYFLEGQTVRIWTSVQNNSDEDLLGSVHFESQFESIGSDQPISALAGQPDAVFVDWVIPSEGSFDITVTVFPWDDGDDASNNIVTRRLFIEADFDRDGIGDNADDDDDNDGTLDANDDFPLNPLYDSDLDGDGIADEIDDDIDGDGLVQAEEAEIGTDPLDEDTDADGIIDGLDPFPLDGLEWQDTDGDGFGDNTDEDIDGDGLFNSDDPSPYNKAPLANTDQGIYLTSLDEEVTFDASGSEDQDGRIVNYLWDFGDEKLIGPTVKKSFDLKGLQVATLTVTDDTGQKDTINVKVRVLDYKFLLFSLLLILLLITLALYSIYRYNSPATRQSRGPKKKTASSAKKRVTKSKAKAKKK